MFVNTILFTELRNRKFNYAAFVAHCELAFQLHLERVNIIKPSMTFRQQARIYSLSSMMYIRDANFIEILIIGKKEGR